MKMRDEEIVALYWARSEDAVAATEIKYGGYCHTISYGILRNTQDAQECVQDTYLRAWESMPPNKPNRLAAYLGKIARNLSLDLYRAKHAVFRGSGQVALAYEELEQCIPARDQIAALTEEADLTVSLEHFLLGLSQEKRKVFLLRYWYFRTVPEICDQLNLSHAKVRSMLSRMRRDLKIHLEQEGVQI